MATKLGGWEVIRLNYFPQDEAIRREIRRSEFLNRRGLTTMSDEQRLFDLQRTLAEREFDDQEKKGAKR